MSNDIDQLPKKYSVTSKPSYETPESNFAKLKNNDCGISTKPAMANRLLDWFSVVMGDAKYRRQYVKSKSKLKKKKKNKRFYIQSFIYN